MSSFMKAKNEDKKVKCVRCDLPIHIDEFGAATQEGMYHTQCFQLDRHDWVWLEESNKIEGVYDKDSFHQALYAWHYLIKQKEMNKGVILKLHKILMLHQDLLPNEKGYWRRCQVWVGNREGAKWEHIPYLVDQWIDGIRVRDNLQKGKEYPSLTEMIGEKDFDRLVREAHVDYERIHPFVDGNGRTGRMLMNWERMRRDLPIEIIYNDEKQDYYQWFR